MDSMFVMTELQTIVVVLAVCQFLFEYFLKVLNEKHVARLIGNQPEDSKSLMDDATWAKASNYSLCKSRFSRVQEVFGFFVFFPVFLYVFPKVFEAWSVTKVDSFWWAAFVATALLNVLQIPSLFFDWYNQFCLEEKFGFNKSTKKLWVLDKIKGTFLGFGLSYLILALLIWMYRTISEASPEYWWAAAFVVFFGIQLLMMVLYPKLILPIFNKLTPLENGELRDKIEAYSKKVGYSLKNIFVIDGSKRSSKANAFFSGLGPRKTIALYDTLIQKHSDEELVSVLAHEVGHFKKKHILLSMILTIFQLGIMCYLFELCMSFDLIANALGSSIMNFHIGIIAFSFLYSPVGLIIGVLMNILSRKNEFEADNYAKETYDGNSLSLALKKLSVDSLSNLYPHPFYVFIHYSHPPLIQRLSKLNKS